MSRLVVVSNRVAVPGESRAGGLAVGLLAGGVFGFSQQLRGAHFLSHDLWTLATCWAVSLGLYLLVERIRLHERSTAPVSGQGDAA